MVDLYAVRQVLNGVEDSLKEAYREVAFKGVYTYPDDDRNLEYIQCAIEDVISASLTIARVK